MPGIIIAVIILIILIWIICANVRVVPQGQAYVMKVLEDLKQCGMQDCI